MTTLRDSHAGLPNLPAAVAAILAILSVCWATAVVADEWPSGRWGGPVVEENEGNRSYLTVILTLTGDGGRIVYPDQNCGGDLVPHRHQRGSQGDIVYEFREQLDYGAERCQGGGIVELRLPHANYNGEQIGFWWRHPEFERHTGSGQVYNLTKGRAALKSCMDCDMWDYLGGSHCEAIFKRKWSQSPAALEACYEGVASEAQACRKQLSCG